MLMHSHRENDKTVYLNEKEQSENTELHAAHHTKLVEHREIIVSKNTADKIKRLLETPPACESECLGENEKITCSAQFDNGYEFCVQLCGVQYWEDTSDNNLPWTQAILYKNGIEVCFTEPNENDKFFGEWVLETDDTRYTVNVITETE